MKILISLPVHECRRTIEDQIRNIQYFIDNPIILLHICPNYKESTDFSMFKNVFVNPKRHKTRWGNIVYLHYSNIQFALKKRISFDYVVLNSSNDLYFRKGVENYLKTSKAFFDPRGIIVNGEFTFQPPRNGFYVKTALDYGAVDDKKLLAFVKKYNLPGICKSYTEGSAYHRTVVQNIIMLLDKEFGFEYTEKIEYCGEELLWPTVALAVSKKQKITPKRQFSYFDLLRDFTPQLWIKSIRYWRGEEESTWLKRYFNRTGAHSNYYAIKGVKRTYYNKVRNYVRSLTREVKLNPEQVIEYKRLDRDYNERLRKKMMKPAILAEKIFQGILAILSRMIFQPRNYLTGTLRPLIRKILRN